MCEKVVDQHNPEKIVEIDAEDDEYSNNPITADSEDHPKFLD